MCCEIEQGAGEEISEVEQNGKTDGPCETLTKQFWTDLNFRISLDAIVYRRELQ